MANPTGIEAITRNLILPKLHDNIFEENVLLSELKKRGNYKSTSGGLKVEEELEYGKSTVTTYSTSNNVLGTSQTDDLVTRTQNDWRHYEAAIVLSGLKALYNQGNEALVDYVTTKVKNAHKSLEEQVSADLYNDQSNSGVTLPAGDAEGINGLTQICDDGTEANATYANIARGSYTWWKANTQDLSGAAITIKDINTMLTQCANGNDRVTFSLAKAVVVDYLKSLLTPNQRFSDAKLAEAGFENIKIGNAIIVADDSVPMYDTSWYRMFHLNLKYLYLRYHKDDNFSLDKEGYVVPAGSRKKTSHIFWSGNLTCSNCARQGQTRNFAIG